MLLEKPTILPLLDISETLYNRYQWDNCTVARPGRLPPNKSALLEDMPYFGITGRKSKDNCCIYTLKWETLVEMATYRAS